jgi:hypothetical protein
MLSYDYAATGKVREGQKCVVPERTQLGILGGSEARA